MKTIISNQTWDNFIWPDWVLPDIKKEVTEFWKEFWKESWGRGPAAWHENAIREKAPKFGTRVRVADFQGVLTNGRFVFAWNNIGRLVGDDGQVKYVGICPFLVSRDGQWQTPNADDYASADEALPFYAAEPPKPIHCTRCNKVLDHRTMTWLVLDTRTGTYTDQEVLDEFNQGAFEFESDCAKIAIAEHKESTKDQPCQHMNVTVYSRQVYPQTWEEPAEYAHKVTCDDCGEELDIGGIPDGAHETEADWEDDYEE